MGKLSVIVKKEINTPVHRVWHALTDPAQIKEYLFGTNTSSDWKKGSPITYSGEWNGKTYTDKGKIVEIIPDRLLHTTYFSGMSGKEDIPANYANVIYHIEPYNTGTLISVEQDNIENEEGVEHMKQNWGTVLDSMKKLLEEGT